MVRALTSCPHPMFLPVSAIGYHVRSRHVAGMQAPMVTVGRYHLAIHARHGQQLGTAEAGRGARRPEALRAWVTRARRARRQVLSASGAKARGRAAVPQPPAASAPARDTAAGPSARAPAEGAAAAPAPPPGSMGVGAELSRSAHAALYFGVNGAGRRGEHVPALGTGAAGRPPGAFDARAATSSGALGGQGRADAGPAPGAAAAAGLRGAPCGAARFSVAAPASAGQAAGPRGSQGIAVGKRISLNDYAASVLAQRGEQQGGSRAPVSSGVKPEGCGARHATPPQARGAAQQQPMAAPAPEPAAAFRHAFRPEQPEYADGEEEADGAWPPAASSAAAAAARGPVLPYGSQGRRLMARLGVGAQGSGPRAGAPSGLPAAEASPLCPPYQACAAGGRGAGAAAGRQRGQHTSSQPAAAAGPGSAAGSASAAAPRTLTALRQAAPHAGVARGVSGPPSARGAAAAGAAPAAGRTGRAGGADASAAAAGAAAGAGAAGQPAARARSAGAVAAAPGGSAGGRAAGGLAAERGAGAGEGRCGPAWPCMVCGALPQAVPWAARCGHSACRACWRRHLAAAQACPACGRETHLRHLAQNYFAGT